MQLTNGDLEISVSLDAIYKEIPLIADEVAKSVRCELENGAEMSHTVIFDLVRDSVEQEMLTMLDALAADRTLSTAPAQWREA